MADDDPISHLNRLAARPRVRGVTLATDEGEIIYSNMKKDPREYYVDRLMQVTQIAQLVVRDLHPDDTFDHLVMETEDGTEIDVSSPENEFLIYVISEGEVEIDYEKLEEEERQKREEEEKADNDNLDDDEDDEKPKPLEPVLFPDPLDMEVDLDVQVLDTLKNRYGWALVREKTLDDLDYLFDDGEEEEEVERATTPPEEDDYRKYL